MKFVQFNVENTRGGVLFLVTLKPATLLKMTLIHGYFFTFLNSTTGTKSQKASHIFKFKVVVVSPLIHLNVQTSQTSVYKACKRENQALSFTGKFISKKKLKLHWRRAYNFTSISCESEMWYTMNLCDEFQHWSENTVPHYPLIYIGCYSIPQKFNPTS